MGLNANAELVWGIPILAFDEEGEPTRFWNDEDDDWNEAPEGLDIRTYGHYEDPDNQRAILTLKDIDHYDGDLWEPTRVPVRDMDIMHETYKDSMTVWLIQADMDELLSEPMDWFLVASYG